MTKFNYKYTKLDDLRDGANKVNVYGIIRFIARCDDIKMVILDETEMPVYCEFTDGPKTDVPLTNDMIVRVHRGLVRRSRNNEMILSGRIGAAGLHLVAWAIDDAGDDVRVKTSPKFSFDPDSDSKRVHELRQFWKNRFHNDGPARLIFFYHIFEVGSTKAVEEVQPRELGNKENEQNSNQLNLAPEEEEDDHFFGGRTSGPSTSSVESDEQNEQPIVDGEYMRALQDKLKQWRNVPSHTKTFVELIFHKRINEKGEFFNVNCQILSILVPRVADGQYPPRNLPSFLRVCDGTVVTSGTKGIQVSPEYYSTKSDLFKERVNYADLQISDFVHYISCWDEFAEIIANDFQAGDLVNVRNIHSKLNIDKERPFEHLFTLRGGGQAFQRGIALLERPQPIVGDLKQQKRSNDENIGEAEEEQQNVKRSKYNEEDVSLEKTDSFPSQSQ